MMTVAEMPKHAAAPAEPEGGLGGLFTGKPTPGGGIKHLRSDARLAATMISLGVVPEEKKRQILRAAFELAEAAASRGNIREFVAVMKVIVAAAKLELDAKRHVDAQPPAADLPLEQILADCYEAIGEPSALDALPATRVNVNRNAKRPSGDPVS